MAWKLSALKIFVIVSLIGGSCLGWLASYGFVSPYVAAFTKTIFIEGGAPEELPIEFLGLTKDGNSQYKMFDFSSTSEQYALLNASSKICWLFGALGFLTYLSTGIQQPNKALANIGISLCLVAFYLILRATSVAILEIGSLSTSGGADPSVFSVGMGDSMKLYKAGCIVLVIASIVIATSLMFEKRSETISPNIVHKVLAIISMVLAGVSIVFFIRFFMGMQELVSLPYETHPRVLGGIFSKSIISHAVGVMVFMPALIPALIAFNSKQKTHVSEL